MKIIQRWKGCIRKVQGTRWGEKYESYDAINVFVTGVDVDSLNKEELEKIDDELYSLAKEATHKDIRKYIKEEKERIKASEED